MTTNVQPETEDKQQAEQVKATVVEEKAETAQVETAVTEEKAEAAQVETTVVEENQEAIKPESEEVQAAEEFTEQSLQAKLMEAEAKLAAAEKKAQDSWDALVRQKAEYENLQKRTERDIEKARKFALEKFANELLPIRDNLELGIEAASKPDTQVEAVIEGMNLTDKALIDVLNKFGIEEINPQDQKFDPEWHEAMAMQPIPNVEDNTVVIVHRKGYHLNERLLRPAQVVVAKQP